MLGDLIAEHLNDSRRGKNTQFPLAEEENVAGLTRVNRELIRKMEVLDSVQPVVLDMDSTENSVENRRVSSFRFREMARRNHPQALAGARNGPF